MDGSCAEVRPTRAEVRLPPPVARRRRARVAIPSLRTKAGVVEFAIVEQVPRFALPAAREADVVVASTYLALD